MQDGIIRQRRTWWTDTATAIAGNVKQTIQCVCADWKAVRSVLFKVLCRFPDAQAAVLEGIRTMPPVPGLLPVPGV